MSDTVEIYHRRKIKELESENAQLKQLLADFVRDANKQSREIVRLRGIIERAIDTAKLSFVFKDILEILNEAGKGGGNQ
jgi:hypothetical protein